MINNLVLGVIPARFASTRFPGKLLAPILGIPLLEHTINNAKRAKRLDKILVATDHKEIATLSEKLGIQAIMTPESCSNGTERIAHLLKNNTLTNPYSIIVNIQGDEPCVAPSTIDAIINTLINTPEAQISTPVFPSYSLDEINDPSIVKCVLNQKKEALYFSRSPIPYQQKEKNTPYYCHLGLYCYRNHFLNTYTSLSSTPLQEIEDLEQLKALEHGYKIQLSIVNDRSPGVNTPEDIKKIENILCTQNSSSSPEA
jgi:3-deoxy-manno-octulosonate cytidylyltransferase (CMP-KDO synthetase)